MWGADSLGNTAKLGSIDLLKCLQAGLQGCILKIGLKKKSHFEEMVVVGGDKLCSGTLFGIYNLSRIEAKYTRLLCFYFPVWLLFACFKPLT